MSGAVISSNVSIKTERFSTNSGSFSGPLTAIISNTYNQYTEVYYISIGGTGSSQFQVYDPVLSQALYTSTLGGAQLYSRVAEEMQDFSQASGTGVTHPKKLVVPNGCQLRCAASTATTLKIVAIQFTNSP